MRLPLLICIVGVSSLTAPQLANAQTATVSIRDVDAELSTALQARCPEQAAAAKQLTQPLPKEERRRLLLSLQSCGASLELFHLRLAAAHMALNAFALSEQSYERALRIQVTESGQAGLLTALVRQKRSPRQEKKMRAHLGYFKKRTCGRGDICSAVAYAAWHVDDHALTLRMAERAIQLSFPSWQPYFMAATAAYELSGVVDERSVGWLNEAQKRAPPASVHKTIRVLLQSAKAP